MLHRLESMALFYPATDQDELALQYQTFVHSLLCVSFLACGVVQYIKQREKLAKPSDDTPEFDRFQRTYIGVFICAVMSDWLKGPYIYVLYQSAGPSNEPPSIPCNLTTVTLQGLTSSRSPLSSWRVT
jgi:hypothetical protein